jgi:hypothetical protein
MQLQVVTWAACRFDGAQQEYVTDARSNSIVCYDRKRSVQTGQLVLLFILASAAPAAAVWPLGYDETYA